jgi:hypothetical protein
METCHKQENVLVDAWVRIDFDLPWRPRSVEERAQMLERCCREFRNFLRDHRSQDADVLTVERRFEDHCSHCHKKWEEAVDSDTGERYCADCGTTIAEVQPSGNSE